MVGHDTSTGTAMRLPLTKGTVRSVEAPRVITQVYGPVIEPQTARRRRWVLGDADLCRTNVLVVEASVIASVIADGGPDGEVCRDRIKNQVLAAPDLLRVEVISVIRRHATSGALSKRQADNALDDLLNLPIAVYPTAPLLHRVWELRGNVTANDACYVALAEALGCVLLTADSRLANAPGTRCGFDLV